MTNQQDAYDAILEGFERMRRAGVDRVLINVVESGHDPSSYTNIPVPRESDYYPDEALTRAELAHINRKRNYAVISLVLDNTMGIMHYSDSGIEFAHRTYHDDIPGVQPFYTTTTHLTIAKELRKFVALLGPDSINADDIRDAVSSGIEEYREITEKLWLKALDERQTDCALAEKKKRRAA